MNRIEQRVKRLEEEAPAKPCNHPSAVLFNPADQEVEGLRRQLDACPNCRGADGPKIVIIKSYGGRRVNRNGN